MDNDSISFTVSGSLSDSENADRLEPVPDFIRFWKDKLVLLLHRNAQHLHNMVTTPFTKAWPSFVCF